MRAFDIAIAGCGPAGLAAALLLARDGHRVSLFDRFEAPRALGSGLMLQPSGMAVLQALGLADRIASRSSPITRLLGRSADGRMVLDARYDELSGLPSLGLGIHRASLFDVLHEALRTAGVTVHTGHEVTSSRIAPGGRRLAFANGREAGPFDLVIDALGLHSPLAPPGGRALPFGALWTTLPWPEDGPFDPARLEQRYRAAREMVGVLPIGARPGQGRELALFWSLRIDRFGRWQDRGLDAWRAEMTALWPDCASLTEAITDRAQITLAQYAHRCVPPARAERLLHIGDAWHTASPQLGQGANMALLDAWGAAQALRLGSDPRAVPALTEQLRGWHVTLYQHATAFFTPLYQSDAAWPAWLRDHVLAPASRLWPGKQIQARLMSGLLGAPLRRLGLEPVDYRDLGLNA